MSRTVDRFSEGFNNSWQMQVASALQLLAALPTDITSSRFREEASKLLSQVVVPRSQWERVLGQGLFLSAALRRLGISSEGVLQAAFGEEANRLVGLVKEIDQQQTHPTNAERVYAIIETEYSRRLTVLSLSRLLHFHRNQLSFEFYRAYHQSIPRYIARRRIIFAATLLRQDRMAIDDVAQTVGYRSKKSFCHRFLQIMGMTPGQFRSSNVSVLRT